VPVQIELPRWLEDDLAAQRHLEWLEELLDSRLARPTGERGAEQDAGVAPGLLEGQRGGLVEGDEPRIDREQLAGRKEHGRLVDPSRGDGRERDLGLGLGSKAKSEARRGLVGLERDLATLNADPPLHQPAELVGAKDTQELPGNGALQVRLAGHRLLRLALPLGAHGKQRIGELEQVRLPRAVLPHEHVQVAPEGELRVGEGGEARDV
jgi:hypothetical protein